MRSTLIFTLLPVVFLTTAGWGQFSSIPLNVDYAAFKGSEGKSYIEVYVSVFQQDLTYAEEDSLLVAHFHHEIKIRQQDSLLFDITRHYKSTAAMDQTMGMRKFIDVFPFELEYGDYSLVVSAVDDVSKRIGEYSLALSVPDYSSGFKLSEIQLSTKIESSGDESNYSLKNNIKIFPNPGKTFGVFFPVMYFYFEGYNLAMNDSGQTNYSFLYHIETDSGEISRSYPQKKKQGTFSTMAEASGVNVVALNNGAYNLVVKIHDMNRDSTAVVRKRFIINKPERGPRTDIVAAKIDGYEQYINYSEEELKKEFDQVRYIASAEEADVFEQLDIEGMKRFLAQFWKRRDPDSTTPVNEYRQVYFEHVRLVNANFSTAFKEGWKTDRGRVVLVYGRPDEIERNPSSLSSQPFEIWYYYSLEGGSEFIFADLSGNGNYELLHSSYRNEIKDPNWRSRVEKVRMRDFDGSFDRF